MRDFFAHIRTPKSISIMSYSVLMRIMYVYFSADELLLTEMIFNGVFTNLSAAQACALLSCFVCDEKSNDVPKLTDELSGPLRQMQVSIARYKTLLGILFYGIY